MKKLLLLFTMFVGAMALIGCGATTTTTTATTTEATTTTSTQTSSSQTTTKTTSATTATSTQTTNTTTTATTTTATTTTVTSALIQQDPTVASGYLVDYPQDGTILHAWNWSMQTVTDHLEEIANAGFSAIQISPMQPQKDYTGIGLWEANWWKLYQPLAFSIATQDNSIGTKADLQALCQAADAYGIKIIVDVVANHMAGSNYATLDPAIQAYEPQIYDQNLIHDYNQAVNDSSIRDVTQGSLSNLPDLDTSSPIVQQRVLSLLEEYVDVGVTGFRFDAAKHIETPSDGTYASDFWPTVINGVTQYAADKGITDLYFYGEILNTAGTGRSYTEYTPYMSVTANNLSDSIRYAITAKSTSNLMAASYITGVPADKSLLWAESHDDFASGGTDNIPESIINKTYVIDASRADATSLYLARPTDQTFMGECGTYYWESQPVTEINRFHNYFSGANESLSSDNGFFLNERYDTGKEGVVIVDIADTGTVSNLTVSHLADGTYHDQISGNTFTVSNGKISGTMDPSGIAIIYNNPYQPRPAFYVSDDGVHGTFSDTKTVTIYSYNTTSASYSIDGGESVPFTGNVDVVLSSPEANATITLDITASYGDYSIERQYEYVKSNTVVTEVTVSNIDQSIVGTYKVVAWTWPQGGDGAWTDGTYDNGTFTFTLPTGDSYFLLVIFPSGTTNYDWSNKIKQTQDIPVPTDGTYDGSQLNWN